MNPTNLVGLIVIALLGALGFVIVFMFGHGAYEILRSVARIFSTTFRSSLQIFRGSLLIAGWWIVGVFFLLAATATWLAYVYWFKSGALDLAALRPSVCWELLDRNSNSLDYLCPFKGVRLWRPLTAISPSVRSLTVFLEDAKFYEHQGLDFDEIMNSLEEDLAKKKLARGGSTITQQLVKNLFLTKEKSFIRKANEIPLAFRLEKELSKEQILELYLNTIEWGPGIYGVEAASRLYFDHPASSLIEEEAWLLVLMIPNPKELNPWVNPRAVKSLLKRAKQLSVRLHLEKKLTRAEAQEALLRFETFLSQWIGRKPQNTWAGRVYPARWDQGSKNSVGVILARAGFTPRGLKSGKNGLIKTHFDKELQARLESQRGFSITPNADWKKAIALIEGGQIRALMPFGKGTDFSKVQSFAEDQRVRAQSYLLKELPKSAIWNN
ncbi:MAG: transglycosylase domain-containing protein [Bdellovibrionota bacterium]